jgi:hypothetical protein
MRRRATVLGLTLVIAVIAAHNATAQEAPPQKNALAAEKQQPKSEAATRLLKTQLQAAQKVYRAALDTMAVQQVGGLLVLVKGDSHAHPDLAYTWSVRWLHAQRDLSETKEARIAAFAGHVKRMKQLREQVKLLVGDGSGGLLDPFEAPAAEWYLAEAELWLLKERGE